MGVIIWVVLCALVGKYAQRLGRNFFGWMVGAMLISPLLGFLILLLIGKPGPEPPVGGDPGQNP